MLHLVFDFSLIFTLWKAKNYYKTIINYYEKIPADGWPCFFLSNHDIGRSIKRFFWEFSKYEKAKLHAVLLLTLRGTPFIYYGEEIGMENIAVPRTHIRDLYGKLLYPFYRGRDGARTPMQWSDKPHAGFSEETPWLPVPKNYAMVNVKKQQKNSDSILSIYKALLALRKEHTALQNGDIEFLSKGEKNILAYSRKNSEEELAVFLNFSGRKKKVNFGKNSKVIFSTHQKTAFPVLQAFEGVVIDLGI
jgi:alpha-glucosidase